MNKLKLLLISLILTTMSITASAVPVSAPLSTPVVFHKILGSGVGWRSTDTRVRIRTLREADLPDNGKIRLVEMYIFDKDCTSLHVEFDSKMNLKAYQKMRRYVIRAKATQTCSYAVRVFLNSPGGISYTGAAMGRMFRENFVATMVVGEQKCISACAMAFTGGYLRKVYGEGVLGFHSAKPRDSDICLGTSDLKSKDYYMEMLGEVNGAYLWAKEAMYCKSGLFLVFTEDDFYGIHSANTKTITKERNI